MATTTAAQQQQPPHVHIFTGAWALDSGATEGDVAGCMRLIGRTELEISLLARCTESQLLNHFAASSSADTTAAAAADVLQKTVKYSVFGIVDFVDTMVLPLDNVVYHHANDHKKFGECDSRSRWLSPTKDAYRVLWSMVINGVPTTMSVTHQMLSADYSSVTMHVKAHGGMGEARSVKYYRRRDASNSEMSASSSLADKFLSENPSYEWAA